MAEKFKRPSVTIGVDKYTFFKVLTDTETETTYDEAVTLPGTVEIAPTDEGGAEPFDADNGAYEMLAYVSTIGHEITNADIPPEVDAMWRGVEMKNGLVSVGTNMPTKYFGVAWRTLKSDGTYRYVRYFKGSYSFASNVGGKTKPSTGSVDKQTAKATFTAVARDYDNQYYEYIDEADLPETVTKETLEKEWFKSMNWKPEAGE